jgi:archaellum component FlaG (FlaF/FlaG flagellin family)
MRKIILTALVTSLVAASTVQIASAAERHSHKTYRDFRGAYNQVNMPSQPNIVDFGFGGRDPSRVGGEDPSLNPSGS